MAEARRRTNQNCLRGGSVKLRRERKMRRLCRLTLIVILISICTAASGDQWLFSWEIGSGTETESGDVRILADDDSMILTSSWLNDYAVIQDTDQTARSAGLTDFLTNTVQTEAFSQRFRSIWNAWLSGRSSRTAAGIFTGDSFECASEEKTWVITWADLSVLLQQTEQILPDVIRDAFSAAAESIQRLAVQNPFHYLIRIYDGGYAYSVALVSENETLATFSVHPDKQKVSAVIGWAENGKDYYWSAEVTSEGEEQRWHSVYMADEASIGFRGLSADAVILSTDGKIRTEGERIQASVVIQPANGAGPFLAEGTAGAHDAALKIFYGEDSEPILRIHGNRETDDREAMLSGKTVLRTDQMTAEDKNILSGILFGHSIGFLYRMYRILPEGIVNLILPEL